MIFVTVGTRSEGFDRLVTWMDDIAAGIDTDVRMQIGHTETVPEHAAWFRFTDDVARIVQFTREADLVVGHGGAGTILTTVEAGTPIVCVPRLEKYGENYDDHQLELTRRLERRGTIAVAETLAELRESVSNPPSCPAIDPRTDLVASLECRLAELDRELP